MTPYRDQDEGESDWGDEGEGESGDDQDSDEEPTVPCPFCKAEILEDSPRCPSCERSITEDDHASSKKPVWVIATAFIVLGGAIWWAFRAF